MRSTIDGLIYWKILNAFKFHTFLEIGVYQGQTTGLFFECNSQTNVVGIDPIDRLDLLRTLYPESSDRFKFIKKFSRDVILTGEYDFILIDGDHRFTECWEDIKKCLPLLSPTGVLAIDDYKLPGVALAIENLYNSSSGLVPFLKAEQTIFWHHAQNDRNIFLDNLLTDTINKFIFIENEKDHHNNIICSARTLGIFSDLPDYFDQALKHYNI